MYLHVHVHTPKHTHTRAHIRAYIQNMEIQICMIRSFKYNTIPAWYLHQWTVFIAEALTYILYRHILITPVGSKQWALLDVGEDSKYPPEVCRQSSSSDPILMDIGMACVWCRLCSYQPGCSVGAVNRNTD